MPCCSGNGKTELKEEIGARITALDVNQARSDVAPFIKNTEALEIWSKEYFLDLVEHITSQ